MNGSGITITQAERIVPLSGTYNLVKEPNIVVRNTNSCINPFHVVDGEFTSDNTSREWLNCSPAIGKYSRLYADMCGGILYIMNDWVLGSEEPDSKNCYNLFEIYTYGLMDRWAVAVYQDIRRGIRVWKNGKDVSGDTALVFGGRYGWGTSLEPGDTPNTLYEFGIRTEPGCWMMMMHDRDRRVSAMETRRPRRVPSMEA